MKPFRINLYVGYFVVVVLKPIFSDVIICFTDRVS